MLPFLACIQLPEAPNLTPCQSPYDVFLCYVLLCLFYRSFDFKGVGFFLCVCIDIEGAPEV